MKSLSRFLWILLAGFLLASGAAADGPGTGNKSGKTEGAPMAAAPAPAADADRLGMAVPKVDLFLGYTFLRFNPGSGIEGINSHGASTNIAFNVNRYLGLVADFGGGGFTTNAFGASNDGKTFTYLFGPRVSWRKWPRAVPFVHALFGGMRVSAAGDSENAFALATGGGLDVIATPRVGIRVFQAEYLHSRFDIPGFSDGQNNFRFSSGVVFRFGIPEEKPVNRAPSATCSASPSRVYLGSGDMVTVRADASDPDGDSLTYTWSASGGAVDGSGSQARWNSAGVAAGTYRITARVADGKGGTASCDTEVTVEARPNRAPTMSCSAERSSVLVGERVRITATANDADGDSLTYSWRTSGGQIVGSGSSVQLDTSGVAPGRYTVTGRVEDGRGGAADCSAAVNVTTPPPPPQASKINECFFRQGSARVDNVCKRILDDIALRMNSDSSATLVLIGYADPRESGAARLAGNRAEQAAAYLAEKGIAGTRVNQRTATGQAGAGRENRRIDVIWVPSGATF